MIFKIIFGICILVVIFIVYSYFASTDILMSGYAQSSKKVWKIMGSWWPYADQGVHYDSKNVYLWADSGPLEVLDRYMKRDTNDAKSALAYERSHYYQENLSKDNAWFGSCDKVGLASLIFKEPVRAVRLDGITFSIPTIKGLLAVIAEACLDNDSMQVVGTRFRGSKIKIVMKNGKIIEDYIQNIYQLHLNLASSRENDTIIKLGAHLPVDEIITHANGNIKSKHVNYVESDDFTDVTPKVFYETLNQWIRKDKRPLIIETDPLKEVWHYAFDKYETKVKRKGGIDYVKTTLFGGDQSIEYIYAFRTNFIGRIEGDGTWISKPPDFIWRAKKKSNWMTIDINHRNPYVTPRTVAEIYRASIRV